MEFGIDGLSIVGPPGVSLCRAGECDVVAKRAGQRRGVAELRLGRSLVTRLPAQSTGGLEQAATLRVPCIAQYFEGVTRVARVAGRDLVGQRGLGTLRRSEGVGDRRFSTADIAACVEVQSEFPGVGWRLYALQGAADPEMHLGPLAHAQPPLEQRLAHERMGEGEAADPPFDEKAGRHRFG